MELYCLGDSLTFGYGVRAAQRWTTLAAQKSGWQLINLGIPGDTTGGMMARLQTQLMPDLAHRRGCRVLLMGGANDIFYGGGMESARANMGGMIHQLLTAGAVPMVGAPLPICNEDISRSWGSVVDFPQAAQLLDQYRAWCRAYCKAFGISCIDFHEDFLLSSGTPDRTLFLDGLHPTARGHELMAQRIVDALLNVEEWV